MAVAQDTLDRLRSAGLADVDPEIADLLGREADRQRHQIELIASENFTWPSVLEAVGSVPTNKYAEGYPGKRYYGGCEVVDEIEQLAIDRAKSLFGAEHANVQPHAGAQANMAAYFALLQPGDTILALRLDHGGHLTHGLKVNFSGRLYTFVHYGVSRETNMVDYDEVRELARVHRPKLIVCGGSAYPRTVDTGEFRRIADEVGALLMCDMAHFSGLVAAGLHPNPVEHCDIVTSTTHKTLAGPRSGFVLCREEHAQAVDRAVFPGMQGGPLEHVVAAKAACFRIAATEAFREYQAQVRANADALSEELIDERPRRAHRRHGHASPPARPARDGLDRQGRRGASGRGEADGEPQHRAVRRAAADGGVGGADRDAGRDDARLRRGGLPRGRADHRRRARGLAGPRRPRRAGGGALRSAPVVPRLPRLHVVRVMSHVLTGQVTMDKLTEVKHPLVQHKLGLLRDTSTDTHRFRQLVSELTLLLTYEATKDLATEDADIETPLEAMTAQRISGKKVAVCPILRAGMGMLDSVLSLIPVARVGFIGLYRNEETLEPVEYYVKLPEDLADRDVILLDPMLATGNSTAAAVELVKSAGASSVRLIALIAAPVGIERIHRDHPDVAIVVAGIDRELNDKGYILPGLGDAGDRLYGTK